MLAHNQPSAAVAGRTPLKLRDANAPSSSSTAQGKPGDMTPLKPVQPVDTTTAKDVLVAADAKQTAGVASTAIPPLPVGPATKRRKVTCSIAVAADPAAQDKQLPAPSSPSPSSSSAAATAALPLPSSTKPVAGDVSLECEDESVEQVLQDLADLSAEGMEALATENQRLQDAYCAATVRAESDQQTIGSLLLMLRAAGTTVDRLTQELSELHNVKQLQQQSESAAVQLSLINRIMQLELQAQEERLQKQQQPQQQQRGKGRLRTLHQMEADSKAYHTDVRCAYEGELEDKARAISQLRQQQFALMQENQLLKEQMKQLRVGHELSTSASSKILADQAQVAQVLRQKWRALESCRFKRLKEQQQTDVANIVVTISELQTQLDKERMERQRLAALLQQQQEPQQE